MVFSRVGPRFVLIVLGALALLASVARASIEQTAVLTGVATPIVVGTPPATPLAERSVEIRGYDYVPAGAVVPVGSTVLWVNEDGRPHTVTAEAGVFDSGAMHRGSRFSHTFTEPGSYRYVCDYHLNMSGVILVDD